MVMKSHDIFSRFLISEFQITRGVVEHVFLYGLWVLIYLYEWHVYTFFFLWISNSLSRYFDMSKIYLCEFYIQFHRFLTCPLMWILYSLLRAFYFHMDFWSIICSFQTLINFMGSYLPFQFCTKDKLFCLRNIAIKASYHRWVLLISFSYVVLTWSIMIWWCQYH